MRSIESGLESYLQGHYRDKSFVFRLRADILIPAFTVSVVSYHGEPLLHPEAVEFNELVRRYREKAYFHGIPISGRDSGRGDPEDPEVEMLLSMERYVRLIHT
ncbi:hypothetical protein ACP26L_17455 [Paenibacillus sp. S-38]|uniref:hypothetical protein n=1 Tax=Paenibacillus sp. S-38 TaxID=3416710 RepID=UPI003CF5D892